MGKFEPCQCSECVHKRELASSLLSLESYSIYRRIAARVAEIDAPTIQEAIVRAIDECLEEDVEREILFGGADAEWDKYSQEMSFLLAAMDFEGGLK